MNMHGIDWAIVGGLLALITAMAIYTRRYTKSVADFLAANRSAGRYLLCISDGMAGLGAITIVMMFEMYYQAGFPVVWWDIMRMMIIPTVLSLSGWIIYRFRQTRALTLAQFFEMRYSKKFRIFSGLLIWFSGIVNFGIFPAVGARFFIYFLAIPYSTFTYVLIMIILLTFSLLFTLMGGQIAVMVTDFIQGVFCNIMFVVIVVVVFFMFRGEQIIEVLSRAPADASMLHPFKISGAEDFNTVFYLILAFTAAYGFLSWQGTQGYNAAARNAHEARMGKSLATWRMLIQSVFMVLLPICAYTFLHHGDFASLAGEAKQAIGAVSNEVIRKQVRVAIALRYILPTGAMGGLCAVMLAAFISTHNTYLHSWGSVFVQDVILPFRKKPLSPKEHIKWLRWSIFGVAAFIFLFSCLFKQTEYIIMFFNITAAIFVGGAGSVIIGGLYWKRGTTAGAWAGMIVGATLAVGSIAIKQIHQLLPFDNEVLSYIASLNGTILSFWSAVGAIVSYIVFSLAGKREVFNLEKMLHRGRYAIEDDNTRVTSEPVKGLTALLGMGKDFNRRDKIIYMGMTAWIATLGTIFVVGTIYNLTADVKDSWWITFWKYYLWVFFVFGSVITVWFAIGGIIDMKKMFNRLKREIVDEVDDGRVFHNNKS